MTTQIELHAGRTSEAMRTRARARMQAMLASLDLEPTRARVMLTDENGPKGGEAVRCSLEIQLPRRRVLHVGDVARTPRLAFDGAIAKLQRTLARARKTRRDSSRRPKKYFAARRALAGG